MRAVREGHRSSVAFFGDFVSQSSFRELNDQYSRGFLEWNVHHCDRGSPLNRGPPADLLFAHPGWSYGEFNGMTGIRDLYRVLGFKDVLNYSLPGPKAEAQLRNPIWDFIAMPYIPEKVLHASYPAKLIEWPDGIPVEFDPTAFPIRPRVSKLPRVLIWAENAGFIRKGQDLNAEVLTLLQREGLKFQTVIKSRYVNKCLSVFADVHDKIIVPHYLDRAGQRRLFDSCDLLLHLHRGGGWELVPMEAAARGVVSVIPAAGPVLRYARPTWHSLVRVKEWNPGDSTILDHSFGCDDGVGYEADRNEACNILRHLLRQVEGVGTLSREGAPTYFRRWAMPRLVKENLAGLSRTFPELSERPKV